MVAVIITCTLAILVGLAVTIVWLIRLYQQQRVLLLMLSKRREWKRGE